MSFREAMVSQTEPITGSLILVIGRQEKRRPFSRGRRFRTSNYDSARRRRRHRLVSAQLGHELLVGIEIGKDDDLADLGVLVADAPAAPSLP